MKYAFSLLMGLFCLNISLFSQELSDSTPSSQSLENILSKGELHITFQDFTMLTDNVNTFDDSWANAFAGRLDFHSGSYHGLSFGFGGSFIMNLGSSHLDKTDLVSGKRPRFERLLFDVEDPMSKDIGGVEELYLHYEWRKSYFTLGRFHISTPLVNLHNGFSRPNTISGVWFRVNEVPNWSLGTGWLVGSSPRSTNVWEDMSGAIGLFGQGYNPDGTKSDYKHHLHTLGLGIVEAKYKSKQGVELGIWNFYLENIVNTAAIQLEYEVKTLKFGAQYFRQDAIGNGGSDISAHRYVKQGHQSNLIGSYVRSTFGDVELEIAHNYSDKSGRFIFPRELGLEQLFSNIARFRMEGLGGAHQAAFKLKYHIRPNLELRNQYGLLVHNQLHNFELNKYNVPKMAQVNLDLKYEFEDVLEGLTVHFLYVYNFALEDLSQHPKVEHGNANFQQFNLILNYRLNIKTGNGKASHKH